MDGQQGQNETVLGGHSEAVSPPQVANIDPGLQAMYRRIPAEVVANMMIDLGLFAHIHSEEDKARHNVAIDLLRDIGVLKIERITKDGKGRLCPKNMKRIVETICTVTQQD